MELPLRKRPRYVSSWEAPAFKNKTNSVLTRRFGLIDLFGSRRQHGNESRDSSATNRNNEPFFTLRMEHREGGAMAQHYGEERILLFRSDQPGAIAKIIFSSSPAEESDEESDELGEDAKLLRMAQAKVHVLSVKEQYRGYGLGALLFSEAMLALRHRYHRSEAASSGESSIPCGSKGSVMCQLDAEEDAQRHNKLVGFYEQLGCQIKPNTKIQYINNNDRETYRKIPMQITLRAQDVKKHCRKETDRHEQSSMINFLPVVFSEATGRRASNFDWLAIETNESLLQFRTTTGMLLIAGPDGQCKILGEDNFFQEDYNNWSRFQLLRVSDTRQMILDCEENIDCTISQEERQKELWMVKSAHGTFLQSDREKHILFCSDKPAFWQADDRNYSLTFTNDSPQRRQHYRKMWAKQTVEHVTSLRQRYTQFSLSTMSLKTALNVVKDIPAKPFSVDHNSVGLSLRTLLVSVMFHWLSTIYFKVFSFLDAHFCVHNSTGLPRSPVERATQIGFKLLL